MMGPFEAWRVAIGITSESLEERQQWSDVIGFDWVDEYPFEKGEEVPLAILHVYAALIETHRFDVRGSLIGSISSLSIGGDVPAPVLETLLAGIPPDDLDMSEVGGYEDLVDASRDHANGSPARPPTPAARRARAFAEAAGHRTSLGPERFVQLIRGLCASPSPIGWCHILEDRVEAGELDAHEIIAAAAVVGWAAIVLDDDPEVRAARLATLLDLGRRGLLPPDVRDQVTTGVSAHDLDGTGAGLFRSITALPAG